LPSSLVLMDRVIYLLALGLVTFIRFLPLVPCFLLGRLAGLSAWMILPRYRALAKRNLRIALGPETSDRELSRLARRHFVNLGANMISSVKIPSLSGKALRSRITFADQANWDDWIGGGRAGGRGTVAALSHFGNWEINAQIAEFVKPRRAGCIYQALRSSRMDDLVNSDRRSRGVLTFDRKKEMQGAAALLRDGGVVGVLTDQHAGNAGIWMPFFGKLASTSPLAASLVKKTGSLLSMVSVRTVGLARWEIRTSPPVETDGRESEAITADLNRLLEEEILASPEDWFWVHNRWKVPHPNFLLSGTKRGVHLPAGTDVKALDPFRIVIRSPNWLGDACMAIPAVRAIKAGRPDTRITLLAPENIAPLWREIPGVDEVLSFPKKASPWKVSRILRRSGPQDVAILLPNSQRSAIEVFLAGIPRRVGRESHRGGNLVNQRMTLPDQLHPVRHQSAELLAMVRGLGGGDPTPLPSRETPAGPLRIAVCPGAEYGPAKRWPADRYRAVMEQISKERDLTWVVVGTAKERDLGEALVRDFPGTAENHCGSTTLPQLIDLLKGCSLLLTNDTGTMHLADALGVPVVAIFGSTEPMLTGPVGVTVPPHRILRRKVECSPCYLRECPIDFRCMKEITVDMVTTALKESLKAIPQGV